MAIAASLLHIQCNLPLQVHFQDQHNPNSGDNSDAEPETLFTSDFDSESSIDLEHTILTQCLIAVNCRLNTPFSYLLSYFVQ